MKPCRCLLAIAGGGMSGLAGAQQAPAAPGAVSGQILSLVIGMAVVLAVIAGAAWLLKRLAPRTYGNASMLRVVAGAAVGPRERVVIVEIDSTWLVVGVAPGCVNTLHQMPRVAGVNAAAGAPEAHGTFAQWLKKFSDKRNER